MPHELAHLEREQRWVSPNGQVSPALRLHVVGDSAMGKSTLINALLSDRLSLLPTGEAGPRTATAISVQYAREPYFEARLATPDVFDRLVSSLSDSPSDHDLATARLLTHGNQYADASSARLGELLRSVVTDHDPPNSDPIRARLHRLRLALADMRADRRTIRHVAGVSLPDLLTDIRTHASGSLAPLTERVDLGWDAEQLAPGLALVDLPGTGMAHDRHELVTRHALAEAHSILWVVNSRGLTSGAMALLRSASFLEELVRTSHLPNPPRLVVVGTHIDGIAYDKTVDARPARVSFDEALKQVRKGVTTTFREQLRVALTSFGDARAVDRTLDRVSIHAVAALEHQRLFLDDDEEPPRATHPDVTGIPALRALLAELARERRAQAATRIDDLIEMRLPSLSPRERDEALEIRAELRKATMDPGATR